MAPTLPQGIDSQRGSFASYASLYICGRKLAVLDQHPDPMTLAGLDTFTAHQHRAVAEPAHTMAPPPGSLRPDEATLELHLRTLDKGCLEQKFVPATVVALANWLQQY